MRPAYTEHYNGRRYLMTCPGHTRHWFTLYGFVGVRSPECQHCGAPNPRPLDAGELREYEACRSLKRGSQ